MAPKAAQEKAKKKAAKQKKILMVLALPMLGALVYAYMTMSSLSGKPKTSVTPGATTPAATAPAAAAPASPVATDPTVTPGIEAVQITPLNSFTALGRKDPFHDAGPKGSSLSPVAGGQSVHDAICNSSVGHGSSYCKKGGKGNSGGSGSSGGGSTPPPVLTGAVISINGKKLALPLGAQFGHAPGLSGVMLFRLIKVSPKSALIGVVGTQQEFTLHVNQPLTLQQEGGWTYKLILEPLGSAAPMTVQPTQPVINDQQTP